MYLKALEIQGFKSFPDKTKLTFEKDVTAIVGPNGSGKSNIADAISWVLGEQRTKTLRGTKMEDVIFGGTQRRQMMGYCEVTLILDNSAHIFDIDSPEVEITRRYYRSGESEYYINREQVRLKDLNNLLMDTGLGRDGYSVIGQGKISEIISNKSSERREVFDEAAGISRYRYRKEEAERRLDKTNENLVRINDKIEELELQVGPLKQQSETAKKYLVLRDDLRIREVSAWMETLDRIYEKAESVNLEYSQAKSALEKAKAELESLYASSDSISERMHRKDEQSENARERLSSKESEASECSASFDVLCANIKSSEEAMQRLIKDISEHEARANEIRLSISENEDRIAGILKDKAAVEEKIVENNNVINGCKMILSSREEALNSALEKQNKLESDIRFNESRVHMLSEMQKEYEGFSNAVKTVMKQKSRGLLNGIHGPVADLIHADDDIALAVETALGNASQHIVTDDKESAKKAIEMLKRTENGRATFLPVDTIKGDVISASVAGGEGVIGVAYDLVDFDDVYDEIIASVLGKTIVVETLDDAIRISKRSSDRFKLVTLDGQVVNVGGSMTGGSAAKSTGVLTRANELNSLKDKVEKLKNNRENVSEEVEKARNNLAAVRYNLDVAIEDRNDLTSQISSLTAEENAVRKTIDQFNVLLSGISDDSETRQHAVDGAKDDIARLNERAEEKQFKLKLINDEIVKIKNEIAEIASARLELEGKRSKAESDTKERFEQINELERVAARIEQKKISSDLEEKQLLDKLWENYELSHSAAAQIRQPIESLAKANKEIAELRKEIADLGTPNIGAIEEYERVSERYEYLTSQRDDVEKAKADLLTIIRDVTKEMKDVFINQFKLINEEFQKTFLDLFGGGMAELALEDETDVLNCGIEINVQPPGKAVQSISLLSGGEMAFVAIALYFAIMKIRPTPFCVMDEIEAALDEANVERFATYMRKMSDKTQFIVITHRRGTMEEADFLYGVTMQEKGVSTVLELDIEQAKKNAEG